MEADPISLMSNFDFFFFLDIYHMLPCVNLLEIRFWSWASEAYRCLPFVTTNQLCSPNVFKCYISKSWEYLWYSEWSLAETLLHLDLPLPLNSFVHTPATTRNTLKPSASTYLVSIGKFNHLLFRYLLLALPCVVQTFMKQLDSAAG